MVTASGLTQAVAMNQPDQPRPTSLLTRADYELHRDHLQELRRVRDRDLPKLLRDARGFVASDAEEEIAQIREDHVFVETRIAHLEALLRDAHVITDGEAPGMAFPGRFVEVEYTRSGKLATYRIAGAGGPGGLGTVSAGSPVGQALIGRAAGDVVAAELPGGRAEELRIIAVGRAEAGRAAA
jgi:transcription elongation factor GreA